MESTRNSVKVRMSEARVSQSINLMNFGQNQYSLLSSGVRSEALAAAESSLNESQSTDDWVHTSTAETVALDQGKACSFYVNKQKSTSLIARTIQWLESEGFEVQEIFRDSHKVSIQIRKSGAWRKVAGMETALRIDFDISENKIKVLMKASKWSADKSIAMTAGWFVFAPLCATAVYGMYEQHMVPTKIANYISSQLD